MINYKNNVSLYVVERLKFLRDEIGITQKQLTKELSNLGYQISEDMISSYERGTSELKVSQLNMFCTYYNVSADFIMGRTQFKNPNSNDDIIEFIILTSRKIKLNKQQVDGIKTLIDSIYTLSENENKND